MKNFPIGLHVSYLSLPDTPHNYCCTATVMTESTFHITQYMSVADNTGTLTLPRVEITWGACKYKSHIPSCAGSKVYLLEWKRCLQHDKYTQQICMQTHHSHFHSSAVVFSGSFLFASQTYHILTFLCLNFHPGGTSLNSVGIYHLENPYCHSTSQSYFENQWQPSTSGLSGGQL